MEPSTRLAAIATTMFALLAVNCVRQALALDLPGCATAGMTPGSSAQERLAWCSNEENHAVRVTAGDRASGRLSKAARGQALASARRCGFVKLLGAVDPAALQRIDQAALAYLKANTESPLITRRGRKKGVGGAAAASQPWNGDAARVELGLPFREPFNDATIANATLVTSLVSTWLGGESLGMELDAASYLSVGPNTVAEKPHAELPLPSALEHAGFGSMAKQLEKYKRLWTDMREGTTTHGVRVEMPLGAGADTDNGAKSFCVGSHSEVFRKEHKLLRATKFAASELCSGSGRVNGAHCLSPLATGLILSISLTAAGRVAHPISIA